MIYLSHFEFPHVEQEYTFIMGLKRTCYDTIYPFKILSKHHLKMLDFDSVTILYGGNGSGKTTALNVIAEKLNLQRDTLYNRSNFFKDYTDLCSYQTECPVPRHSRIITSDDVFDFMLNLRSLNEGVDRSDCHSFTIFAVHARCKIYDMDEEVVDVKRWTQLENVRAYYEFFKRHEKEF